MTTTVTVQAHCSEKTEVVVTVAEGKAGKEGDEVLILQDGQSIEKYVYEDRMILVRERGKTEFLTPGDNLPVPNDAPIVMADGYLADEPPIVSDESPVAEPAPDALSEPSTDVAPTRDTDDAIPA